MPNPEHLAKLKEGVQAWNKWRESNPSVRAGRTGGLRLPFAPNLSDADLSRAKLGGADLSRADLSEAYLGGAELIEANLFGANLFKADLSEANLSGANLMDANLRRANLSEAYLIGANLFKADLSEAYLGEAYLRDANLLEASLRRANLTGANLSGANLREANFRGAHLFGAELSFANLREADLGKADLRLADLSEANLSEANLSEADLSEANLIRASLVGANFEDANLTGCNVHGISVWNARLDRAKQSNLLITPKEEPAIRVDSLEVAQFIYLLLNNAKIRHVIDTIGKKAVLILGRFSPERKVVLDSIREALRQSGFLPILFDFETPSTRDTHETIVTLAGLSRFVIADITDPKSIPQELVSIVPTLPSVPVQPLLQAGHEPWGMNDHIKRYPWVLPLFEYDSTRDLLQELESKVIAPAEEKAKAQTRG